jgi:hypothetical protein
VCQAALKLECDNNLYLDQVAAAPSSAFAADAAISWFELYQQKLDACEPTVDRWSSGAEGLRSVFKGTLEEHQSCRPSLGSDRATLITALLSCSDPATFGCMPSSLLGEWTCTAKSTDGDCLTDNNCQDSAHCNNPTQEPFGTCELRRAVGAECEIAADCDSLFCVEGRCVEADVERVYCPAL